MWHFLTIEFTGRALYAVNIEQIYLLLKKKHFVFCFLSIATRLIVDPNHQTLILIDNLRLKSSNIIRIIILAVIVQPYFRRDKRFSDVIQIQLRTLEVSKGHNGVSHHPSWVMTQVVNTETITIARYWKAEVASHFSKSLSHFLSAVQNSNDTVNVSNVHSLSVFVTAAVHLVYGCCRKHANVLLSPRAKG